MQLKASVVDKDILGECAVAKKKRPRSEVQEDEGAVALNGEQSDSSCVENVKLIQWY